MSDRVAEIRARLAAATPGPWTSERGTTWRTGHNVHWIAHRDGEVSDRVWSHRDAALIAAAPADLEWACGEIERLNRELSDARSLTDLAYREGAEAMREAAAQGFEDGLMPGDIRALPIPEPKR